MNDDKMVELNLILDVSVSNQSDYSTQKFVTPFWSF